MEDAARKRERNAEYQKAFRRRRKETSMVALPAVVLTKVFSHDEPHTAARVDASVVLASFEYNTLLASMETKQKTELKNTDMCLDAAADKHYPTVARAWHEALAVSSHFQDACANPIISNIANLLRVNPHACFGMCAVGKVTDRHTHAMPVAHLLLTGEKEWHFWPPDSRAPRDMSTAVHLTQSAGDIIHFPAGWYHHVATTSGKYEKHLDVVCALHLVGWSLPLEKHLLTQCMLPFMGTQTR